MLVKLSNLYRHFAKNKMFKRHLPGEFRDCSWVFLSGHCSSKPLGLLKKEKVTYHRPIPGSSL